MKNRWLLKIALLVFIGVGFVGITSAINMFSHARNSDNHEFAYAKRMADQHWYRAEFADASRYYKQLADADQTNGSAHFLYALSLNKVIDAELKLLKKNPDEQRFDQLKNSENLTRAIAGLEKSLKFTQFRTASQIRLSLLHGLKGDRDKSIEYALVAREGSRDLRKLRSIYATYGCLDVLHEVLSQPPTPESN